MEERWGMKVYMKGAALLTLAALFVKVLSAVYRVPFQNFVGDQGFYIYQQVYPFIAIFVVWTSSGFAVAISKMLADVESGGDRGVSRQIRKIAFYYLTALSIVFFLLLFAGADVISLWMGDEQLAALLRTGSFVTLCMPILAVLKGSFQSRGLMAPVAYAQVIEQFARVMIILGGTWIVMTTSASLYRAGQMAMLGSVVGELAGIILLGWYFNKSLKGQNFVEQPRIRIWPVVKEMTLLSISVSMSGLVLLCFQLVDSFTVFSLLVNGGMPRLEAMETKGIYDRGQPLVQMGILIASSLSLAIVPLVAHASKKKSGRDAVPFIQLTYRTAILFGWAATLGLVLILPSVNEMLFETRDLSIVLMVFVGQILWLSIILTITAILQGLGKLKIPAYILLAGLLVKVLANYAFIPLWGVLGAALAGNVGLAFIAIGLIVYFKKIRSIKLASSQFYRWLGLASLAMVVAVLGWSYVTDHILFVSLPSRVSSLFTSITAVSIGAFVFLTIVAKKRVLSEKEWFLLPFGRRMAIYQLRLQKKIKNK